MHFGEPLGEDRYAALIRHAYDQGIRTFITADAYGTGDADKALGDALEGLPRDSYCLAGAVGHDFYQGLRDGSKGFPRFTDPSLRQEKDYAAYLRMAAEKSLERCRLSSFDLLLLHNPDWTGYSSDAVWSALESLRESGLTRLLGVAPGPANGFTLDLLHCFDRFGSSIDWAMIILNPLEPWPGTLCLESAEKNGVQVITRVVDHGGLFHGDVLPGHRFGNQDHRTFRPAGWVEEGCAKIDQMRPIAEQNGLSLIQLAAAWNLAHPGVASVVPTFIQESGEDARPIEDKVRDLASLSDSTTLSRQDLEQITQIGDNKGCMALKGGSRQFQGPAQADQWPTNPQLEEAARRWSIRPDADLYCAHDPRDLREKGMPRAGTPQAIDRRLFLQLQVFTGADAESTRQAIAALRDSKLHCVLYADFADPRGLGILLLTEDPEGFVGPARETLAAGPFASLTPRADFTMTGRTYGFGREPDIGHWMLRRPYEQVMRPDWPWAVWYPLRRKGAFYRLPRKEQMEILREHGSIGFNYGGAGYAGDVRLECFGIDREDNEFLLGLMGPRLYWLSKLVEEMRPTVQTSEYIEKLGPFFVGRTLYQSGMPDSE